MKKKNRTFGLTPFVVKPRQLQPPKPPTDEPKDGLACAFCHQMTGNPIWQGATPFCSFYCQDQFRRDPKPVKYPVPKIITEISCNAESTGVKHPAET